MKSEFAFAGVLVLLVFSMGCPQPPGGNGNPPGGNGENPPGGEGTKPMEFELDEETELRLMEEFGCDIGVDEEERLEDFVVMACIERDETMEMGGIYWIGAHPVGVWSVTYIVYDGKDYSKIDEAGQLTPLFAPIETGSEALAYVCLHEGLNRVSEVAAAPLAGKTGAEKAGDIFRVTVLHADREMCPCYGTYWKSTYEVTAGGEIRETGSEEIYSYSEEGCMC